MNSQQSLIMIENSLLLVDVKDEDDCILNELYSHEKYYLYVLYKYDEEEDSLMIWKLIKVFKFFYSIRRFN